MITLDDALAAADGISDVLEQHRVDCEELRRLHPASVAALRGSGLSRLLTPARFGGHESSVRAQVETCVALARSCPATSWVHMVCGAHTFVVGAFPEACQAEVFADPDVLIAGTLSSQGTVERTDGGWMLNGRWQFCSGVDHSPWLLIGARQIGHADDEHRIRNAHCVVPVDELTIDDTWFTLGMRGTGSKDIVAESVFVPDHRAMATGTVFPGMSPHGSSSLYRLPVLASLSAMLAGSVLGTAERGFGAFVGYTRGRRDIYGGGSKAASASIQRRIAEAELELRSARLLLAEVCEALDAWQATDPQPVPEADRVELRANTAFVVELSRRATNRLFDVAGAHAVYDPSELQRVHRDVNTASHHAICDLDSTLELAGRAALGLELGTPLV